MAKINVLITFENKVAIGFMPSNFETMSFEIPYRHKLPSPPPIKTESITFMFIYPKSYKLQVMSHELQVTSYVLSFFI